MLFSSKYSNLLTQILFIGHSNQSRTFDQLDDYSLLNIFDYLELNDLVNVATLNERYKQLILHYQFFSKFISDEAKFYIDLAPKNAETEVSYAPANSVGRIKLSRGHNNLFSILSVFCSKFGRMFIENHQVDDDLLHRLADIVNTHCSNVPQTMSIIFSARASPKFTFENVTSLIIRYAFNNGTTLELNKPFPRLTKLSIGGNLPLNQHLPHLQHFMYDSFYNGQFDLSTFGAYNPQLSSIQLGISWPPFKHLKDISELFSNLETF